MLWDILENVGTFLMNTHVNQWANSMQQRLSLIDITDPDTFLRQHGDIRRRLYGIKEPMIHNDIIKEIVREIVYSYLGGVVPIRDVVCQTAGFLKKDKKWCDIIEDNLKFIGIISNGKLIINYYKINHNLRKWIELRWMIRQYITYSALQLTAF